MEDNIYDLKKNILIEVAKLAFDGCLENEIDEIPYRIIKGPYAKYRCCVYKEREIVSQRVRLACGKKPLGTMPNNSEPSAIHVIDAACEECPISRFIVTENCQNCLSKRCKSVCKFGAISIEGKKAHIDKSACKECGKCKDACPFGAIADLVRPCIKSCPVKAITVTAQEKATIDHSKCINCGNCITQCPFSAISDISYIVDVIKLLKSNEKKYAIIAPALKEQFKKISINGLKNSILALGFDKVFEAADGAVMVCEEESEIFDEFIADKNFMISSCCPSFVELINKHFPKLKDNISSSKSPMIKTAQHIKLIDKDAKIVFIGPCISKKLEIQKADNSEFIDYVLTSEELLVLFKAKNVSLYESNQAQEIIQESKGQKICKSGGLSLLLEEYLSKTSSNNDLKTLVCNGVNDCKKNLMLAQKSTIKENFIEGMCCENGCIGGPCKC